MNELTDHQFIDQLNTALDGYETIQTRHLELFKKDLLTSLSICNFERAKSFENLKGLFTLLLREIYKSNTEKIKIKAIINARLPKILEQDKLLMAYAKTSQQETVEKLRKLEHGKIALKGYGSRSSNTSPRLVHRTT